MARPARKMLQYHDKDFGGFHGGSGTYSGDSTYSGMQLSRVSLTKLLGFWADNQMHYIFRMNLALVMVESVLGHGAESDMQLCGVSHTRLIGWWAIGR